MDRREFCKHGLGGIATLAACGAAQAAEAPAPVKIDPDALAAAAREYFLKEKKTCAEAMLFVGSKAIGMQRPPRPDMALGLAGGVGLMGRTCGVVTGGAMALSMAISQRCSDRKLQEKQTFAAAREFCRRFEKDAGTSVCRTLSGLDLTTPEGRKALKQRVKAEKCSKYVEAGARTLAKMLQKIQSAPPANA